MNAIAPDLPLSETAAVGALSFRVGCMDDAADLVRNYHYSRRFGGNIQVVGTWHEPGGLFGDYGRAVAACVFAIPGATWGEPVFELIRLVRVPELRTSLTGLIAATVRHLKVKGGDLLVSYADPTAGHHGGIYQAASWKYAGRRANRSDGLVVGGIFVPGRTCNRRWGTRSPVGVSGKLPHLTVEPHFDLGKHLYWRPLTKAGGAKAERLGLLSLPYPKPDHAEAAGDVHL